MVLAGLKRKSLGCYSIFAGRDVKIREWEIRQYMISALGPETDAFDMQHSCLRVWAVRPALSVYQRGELIAIEIDGVLGDYFSPDLGNLDIGSPNEAGRLCNTPVYT